MTPRWMKITLYTAAVYNLAWGGFTIFFPNALFDAIGAARPNYPGLWQCIGMIVGVYGIGYGLAGRDPVRHWPIVLVGLLGKIFGPIGFVDQAIVHKTFPLEFGYTIIFNDLIWWVPFALILRHARREERRPVRLA